MQLVLFNLSIGTYQVLPFWARVDLGAMATKRCYAFLKALALLEPHHQIVLCHTQDDRWAGGSYPSAEKQLVYSKAPADWAIPRVNFKTVLFQLIQLSISKQFRCQNSSISNYLTQRYRPLSGATTPSQRGPGSDGNKGVLRIP